jgi:hypothetical protein
VESIKGALSGLSRKPRQFVHTRRIRQIACKVLRQIICKVTGRAGFYLGEYTARRGFAFSETNSLINNLRKPMERRGRPEWRYKESAILTCGRMLREAISEEWLDAATLVPVPGSSR